VFFIRSVRFSGAASEVAKTVILSVIEKFFTLIIRELDFSLSVEMTTILAFETAPRGITNVEA